MVNLGNQWDILLKGEFEKPYYRQLREFLKAEYNTYTVYPGMYDIFNALKLTSYEDVKAVILGQDPYHEPGQAHGLAFSVKEGIALPPSLKNIYKELNTDLGIPVSEKGDPTKWAQQGVLLLNTLSEEELSAANIYEDYDAEGVAIINTRDVGALQQVIVGVADSI